MATDFGHLRIGEFARRVGVSPSCCAPGSRATGCCGRFARRAASGSTRPTTPRAWSACAAASTRASRPRRPRGPHSTKAGRSEGLLEDAAARLLAAIRGYDEAVRARGARREPRGVRPRAGAEPGRATHPEAGRRRLGARRARDQPRALREQPDPRQAARPRPVLGPRHRAARAPRLRARRDARHHACSRSRSSCARTAGASSSSARTRRSRRSTQTAKATRPALVVVASFDASRCSRPQAAALRRLARAVPLALAGPGATDALSARLGARRLDGDLVAAADEVARA